jgi:hypothetical protein
MTEGTAKRSTFWLWFVGVFIVLLLILGTCYPTSRTKDADQAPAYPYEPFATPTLYSLRTTQGAQRANLRSGPGKQYEVLATITPAEDVVAIGRATGDGKGWLVVRLPAGAIAYAKETLLKYKDGHDGQPQPPAGAKTYRTSFKCEGSRTAAEVLICEDAALAASDLTMASLYQPLLIELKDGAREKLKADQARWLVERESCIDGDAAKECLSQQYQVRILTLQLSAQVEPNYDNASSADVATAPIDG